MRANELMIGDWVMNKYDSIQVREILEGGINGEWDGGECYGVEAYIDDIKPIPLTPEILEKNGFDFVKSSLRHSIWNGYWLYEDLELGTCCLDRDNNWPCFFNLDDMNIKCEYVHQLQHALRLCGFDELADNFKI